ncbi:MAG: hypothetical protein FWD17_16955, partial [Polyangiaceae bacterium]|nr:hypothetical protein [Polyangiaceae bacterium]
DPPTPLESWLPGAPQGVHRAIERCLAKERDDRFQNIAELAGALEPLSPQSAGAANRVREVLSMPPPFDGKVLAGEDAELASPASLSGHSDTNLAFDGDRSRTLRRTPVAAAAGAAIAVLAIAGVVGFARRPASPSPIVRPAATVEAPSPAPVVGSEVGAALGAASAPFEHLVLPPRPVAHDDAAAPAPSEQPPPRPAQPARKPVAKPSHPESTRM